MEAQQEKEAKNEAAEQAQEDSAAAAEEKAFEKSQDGLDKETETSKAPSFEENWDTAKTQAAPTSQPILSHAQAAPKPVAAAPVQKPTEAKVEVTTTVAATTSTTAKAKVAVAKPVQVQAKVEA